MSFVPLTVFVSVHQPAVHLWLACSLGNIQDVAQECGCMVSVSVTYTICISSILFKSIIIFSIHFVVFIIFCICFRASLALYITCEPQQHANKDQYLEHG